MKTSLVILAAGIGSRFGGGIKQLEPVGPHGEIILEYSIYDALEAGFNKVVFIIRPELEQYFNEMIGDRLRQKCEVVYVYQTGDNIPSWYTVPAERKKPFGTAQAILCCRDAVKEPFLVINADDYYGREAYKIAHGQLISGEKSGKSYDFCMVGFILKNTLSDNGAVSRGICCVDEKGYLTNVTETGGLIRLDENTVEADGKDGEKIVLSGESIVSMNMWGLTPDIFPKLEDGFAAFLRDLAPDNVKAEYYLPSAVDALISNGLAGVKVLSSRDKWFGVTYREDKEMVVKSFRALHEAGVYGDCLI
ncbi:MAG: NTP transferase domain-containing protein [Clostridia bacterium]|nr:NTP transferase domain-containing protein [Clostridia bacterium]